ncbi:MAG: hypothetical protein ACH36H_04630 [Candidatus Nanopelagicales bacterium]
MNSVYIIRDAAFGRDFMPKLIMGIVAIALALWDARRQRRADYLWVAAFGTALWGGAEWLLSVQRIRDMPERVLLGTPIGDVPSYLLQGLGEGAMVAVLGLFLGDRWLANRRRGTILAAVWLVLVAAATIRNKRLVSGVGEAASRRDVLDLRALLMLGAMVALAAAFYWRWRRWRPRTAAMFIMMVLIGGVWTIAQTAIGGRWVEVAGSAPGTFTGAGTVLTIATLSWDVVFEIAAVYLPFLAIPVMLRLIRSPLPLPIGMGDGAAPGTGPRAPVVAAS